MNETRHRPLIAVLLVAAVVLVAAAWLRSAEYDEQYTLFVTAGIARPVWPADAFPAGMARTLQSGHAGLAAIAHDLRATDVHPPLYFWAVAAWRGLAGEGLFAARLLSALCSLAALCGVAVIARSAGIPVATAVLLTLGCYGFVYAGTIARGFAVAQMLSVWGVALLLRPASRRPGAQAAAAGLLLGAATFANYLAVFVGCAGVLHSVATSPCRRRSVLALCGFVTWLPADLWFFLAQRHSRIGQFPPFDPLHGAARLAQYAAANLLGGLPLYVDGIARWLVAAATAVLLAVVVALVIGRWRCIATPDARRLLAMAAAAPPIGLLLLGLAFDNTPIELRYLAFATPFTGLLLAGALPGRMRSIVLAVQVISLLGLMTRAETMQPARATAHAAAVLAQGGVVMLPRGNDGVGIVGAFAIEAPATLRLLVVGKDEPAAQIRARAGSYRRVVVALLAQDADSRATLPAMRAAFDDTCWRAAGEGFATLAFELVCGESR